MDRMRGGGRIKGRGMIKVKRVWVNLCSIYNRVIMQCGTKDEASPV